MKTKTLITALLAYGLVVFSAGCSFLPIPGRSASSQPAGSEQSGSLGRTATPKRPSACSMINKAEMEEVLVGPLASAEAEDSGYKTTCTYAPPEGSTRYARVEIEWEAGEAAMAGAKTASKLMGSESQEMSDAARKLGMAASEPVAGVGDDAQMILGGVMMVRKGEAVITIDLRMQPEAKAKAIMIAQKVLGKI